MFYMNDSHKKQLLNLARLSIEHGLEHGRAPEINLDAYPQDMQKNAASFVTLQIHKELRGCIGTLEAYQPMVKDVNEHAFAAAFSDSRFPALTLDEFKKLHIEISILSAMTPIDFIDESDLFTKLKPFEDGLTIEDGMHKATFLPQVWDSLNQPQAFLTHLKQKGGFADGPLASSVKAYKYQVLSFEETKVNR